jgi:hypothetical protein
VGPPRVLSFFASPDASEGCDRARADPPQEMGDTVHEGPEDVTLVLDERPLPGRGPQRDGVRPVPAGQGPGQRRLEIVRAIGNEKGPVADVLHDPGRAFEVAVEIVVEPEGEPQRSGVALPVREAGEAAEVEKADGR